MKTTMRRFGSCLTALALFGCGGPGVDSAEVALRSARPAPMAVLELDLPGCECLGLVERGEHVRVLRHPLDDGLVILDVEGRPACIDSPRAALEAMRASAARLAPTLGNGQLPGQAANVAPEDDPVPIKEAEGGETGGEGNDEGSDDNGQSGQSGPDQDDGRGGDDPGGVVKLSTNGDDPVPIIEIQPHIKELLANSN
jgi:hypothetical protein